MERKLIKDLIFCEEFYKCSFYCSRKILLKLYKTLKNNAEACNFNVLFTVLNNV